MGGFIRLFKKFYIEISSPVCIATITFNHIACYKNTLCLTIKIKVSLYHNGNQTLFLKIYCT